MARAASAGVGLPSAVADSLIRIACSEVSAGRFKYGGQPFFAHVLSTTTLPFLLYLSLRRTDSTVTREAAANLITEENEAAVSRAVLEQFGYGSIFEPKKEGDEKKGQAGEVATTGPESSPSSAATGTESAASPTPTSQS